MSVEFVIFTCDSKGQNLMRPGDQTAQKLFIFVLPARFQTLDKYPANGSRFRTRDASETERSHLLWNDFYAKQIDGGTSCFPVAFAFASLRN